MGRAFASSLLAGDPSVRGLLPLDFRDEACRIAKAREAAGRAVHPELAALLRAQDRRLPPSGARLANIDALATSGTAVVVTGQQVGLFLGPLYTVYKAASAIAVARAMERESGVRCVPVFWLQTEDHDFPEIDHCHVMDGAGEPVRLSLPPDPDSRVSVAHRSLGEGVLAALASLEAALGAGAHAAETVALFRVHYRPERSLGDAFAGVLTTLFADEGLVILDPRDEGIARLAAPVVRTSLTAADEISSRLLARREALRTAGFDEQVQIRPGCPLAFFHQGSALGPRYRLERRGGCWGVAGSSDTVDGVELLATLERDPMRFSTSALLRPILQDTLLPTAATIGGPGEISYFAQLGPLYDLYGLPQPLVIPRARFRIVDEKTRSVLAKVGLGPADVEQPTRELLLRVPRPEGVDSPEPGALAETFTRSVLPHLAELERTVVAVDGNLSRPAQRTRDAVTRAVQRLIDKYGRARIEKDAISMRRIARLQATLYPQGTPQERFYAWPAFAARHGGAALRTQVLSALSPFAASVQDLCP